MARSVLIAASSIAHVALVLGLGSIEVERTQAATAIEVFELPEPPPPEPPPPEPPPPEPEAPRPEPQPQAPKVQRAEPRPSAPEPAPSASSSALDALPDLGLSLGGAADGGGGGFAVRQGTRANGAAQVVRKVLAPATRIAPKADACAEPAGAPKVIELPRPAYTEAARAAGIEGKVRVRITVDERGTVVSTQVLEGLGHGLDEAALTAARAARFEAALRCGKAVSSTFTLSIRFSAS